MPNNDRNNNVSVLLSYNFNHFVCDRDLPEGADDRQPRNSHPRRLWHINISDENPMDILDAMPPYVH